MLMHRFSPLLLGIILLFSACQPKNLEKQGTHLPAGKPRTVSFSFDDGNINDMPGYDLSTWNQMILGHLDKAGAKAMFFIKGSAMANDKGRGVMGAWDKAGHYIANHTWSHPNCSSPSMDADRFRNELLRTDSLIRPFSNFRPFFRFPYLKEGSTPEKAASYREVLNELGYRNGYVTIDASDWYIDSRLVKRLREQPGADISGFRDFYVQHMYARAEYYDSLAHSLHGRDVPHILLLHHNLAAALFLGDLIQRFKDHGWEVADAAQAYEDPVYRQQVPPAFAGESFFWSGAKATGKYDAFLRYPAEDGGYEKSAMDALGL